MEGGVLSRHLSECRLFSELCPVLEFQMLAGTFALVPGVRDTILGGFSLAELEDQYSS